VEDVRASGWTCYLLLFHVKDHDGMPRSRADLPLLFYLEDCMMFVLSTLELVAMGKAPPS
jgi:hypothetical protein